MTRTAPRLRRQIAKPVLGLPAARALFDLDPLARAALAEVLADLGDDAAARAQRSWAQNKGNMAAYWKAVSVYARHIRRVLVAVGREGPSGPIGREAGAASPLVARDPAGLGPPGSKDGLFGVCHAGRLMARGGGRR